ncbi:MAG: hypothetical protein H6718_25715 [Polyangiaceae bacterium]|nr:hypothetical protein [Polyangiaceae bacterium]MCB9605394.1 hypothetical protein [Polyangiaceae bacterium]
MSRVLTIDVSDPTTPQIQEETRFAGRALDAFALGDRLYVTSLGECSSCGDGLGVTVRALDLSGTAPLSELGQLTLPVVQDAYGWLIPSVLKAGDSLYTWIRTPNGERSGTLQALSLNPGGTELSLGASVTANYELLDSSQLDERSGVLRVIGQPGALGTISPPLLETFALPLVDGAASLASVPLTALGGPGAVRFAGDRLYAASAAAKGSVIAVDLSDPSAPIVGTPMQLDSAPLYLEPRGNELWVLGQRSDPAANMQEVAVYDMTDVSAAVELDRADFGGESGVLTSALERGGQPLSFLDGGGTVLVPLERSDLKTAAGCQRNPSGIQLFAWDGQALSIAGFAAGADAPRAVVPSGSGATVVSPEAVISYDLSDRSAPQTLSGVPLARQVDRTQVIDGRVLRIGGNARTKSFVLDSSTPGEVSDPFAGGSIGIESGSHAACSYGFSYPELFVHGSLAYLAYAEADASGASHPGIAVVDMSDERSPKLLAQELLSLSETDFRGGYGLDAVVASGARVAQLGSTLGVVQATRGSRTADPSRMQLEVVDLSAPDNIRTQTLEMPGSFGQTALVAYAGRFYASHFEPVGETRARFFLDVVDVSDPSTLSATSISAPGSLLGIDEASGKLLFLSYSRQSEAVSDPPECAKRHGSRSHFEPNDGGGGTCTWLHYTVHLAHLDAETLTVEAKLLLNDGERPDGVAVGQGLAVTDVRGWWVDGNDHLPSQLTVLGGIAEGKLMRNDLTVGANTQSYYTRSLQLLPGARIVVAADQRRVDVIDASDPQALRFSSRQALPWTVYDLAIDGDQAFAALGSAGGYQIGLTP